MLRYCFEADKVKRTLDKSKRNDLAVFDSDGISTTAVIVLTPYYRANDFSSDSDVTPNNNGVYLYQVSDTVLECAKKTRVACEDLYYNLGANWITRYFYTIDGTHPTTKTKKAIASRIIDLASKSGVMD